MTEQPSDAEVIDAIKRTARKLAEAEHTRQVSERLHAESADESADTQSREQRGLHVQEQRKRYYIQRLRALLDELRDTTQQNQPPSGSSQQTTQDATADGDTISLDFDDISVHSDIE